MPLPASELERQLKEATAKIAELEAQQKEHEAAYRHVGKLRDDMKRKERELKADLVTTRRVDAIEEATAAAQQCQAMAQAAVAELKALMNQCRALHDQLKQLIQERS